MTSIKENFELYDQYQVKLPQNKKKNIRFYHQNNTIPKTKKTIHVSSPLSNAKFG